MISRAELVVNAVNGKVLDVGYVSGDLHNSIRKKISGKNLFGLDTHVKKQTKNHRKGTAEKIPFEKNYFDCVVAGELIEHVKKPALFLKEANRVLKNNGLLIITTPNKKSLINRVFHSYETKYHISCIIFQ